jgi:hypothetical protein
MVVTYHAIPTHVIWNLCCNPLRLLIGRRILTTFTVIPFVCFLCPETTNISVETLNLVFLREVKDLVKEAARLARLEKGSSEVSTAKRTHFGERDPEHAADEKVSIQNEAFAENV